MASYPLSRIQSNEMRIRDYPQRSRRNHPPIVFEVADDLAEFSDLQLENDAYKFAKNILALGEDESRTFSTRAPYLARDPAILYADAKEENADGGGHPKVRLSDVEKELLRGETDKLFSQPGIFMVRLSISLAGFLQGSVQASINSSSMYQDDLGLPEQIDQNWLLGIVNATPYLAAALIGCWISLPINDRWGRRGGLMVSAIFILVSSLASGLAVRTDNEKGLRWKILLGVRVVNGIGMGIKAVSAPILASETAIRFWRGSLLLHWQLWVACGIAIGMIVNLIIVSAWEAHEDLQLAFILGFPLVPSCVLFVALFWCQESPRYYMRGEKISYNPGKAYTMLMALRGCDLLAQRDIYVLYKDIQREHKSLDLSYPPNHERSHTNRGGGRTTLGTRFIQLFTQRRLRNAIISTATVNLAQQLCGINFGQFYSGPFFSSIISDEKENDQQEKFKLAIGLSVILGAINFFFGWPAMKTIDTLGRRKWLIATLPFMTFFMLGGTLTAVASSHPKSNNTDTSGADSISNADLGGSEFDTKAVAIIAVWLYLHAIAYSPGLGPIPFTLASESFPLPHRELGCAFAIGVNLFFAGILSLVIPFMLKSFRPAGTMGFFTGTNFLAFFLVFFLVEETTELSLEGLNARFGLSKIEFARKRAHMLVSLFKRLFLGIRDVQRDTQMDDEGEMAESDWPGFEGMNTDISDESHGPSPRTSLSVHNKHPK